MRNPFMFAVMLCLGAGVAQGAQENPASYVNADGNVVLNIDNSLPFFDGFESGSLVNWTVNAGGSGDPLVHADTTLKQSNVPHTGSFVAFLGAASSTLTGATLALHMNLTAVDVVEINFWWLGHGLGVGNSARVDVNDGTWHVNVDGLESKPSIWTQHTITLDRAHYNFTSDVILQFVALVEHDETWDALYLDDISVQGFTSPDNLVVTPRMDSHSSGFAGGPFAPASHTYTLYNRGASLLNWTAASGAVWLDIAPAGGALAAGASVDVTATVNATANTYGVLQRHSTMLEFTNTDSGYSQTRGISLDVLGVIANNFLSVDQGWTMEGDWAYGAPTGYSGPSGADPTAGYTGTNVYGYNLSGYYTINMPPTSLTSTALPYCSYYEGIHVEFYRWLGVENAVYDRALFQVSNDGTTWTSIWGNLASAHISESAWSRQIYDISAVADGQPEVYLRWVMGPTDDSVNYPGWNIDDITFYGVSSAPIITSMTETPDRSGARIELHTDRNTTVEINYGMTQGGPYSETAVSDLFLTIHTLTLYPLEPLTTYYYELTVTDERGATTTQTGSLATGQAHTPLFTEDFEGGNLNAWDVNYDTAGGNFVLDATVENGFLPYEGAKVARFGPVASNADLVLDLSGLNAVELSFAWLAHGLEDSDYLRMDLFDGAWHTDVFTASRDAGDWVLERYVIAANQYNMINGFIVRFQGRMGSPSEIVDAVYLDMVSVGDVSSPGALLVTGPVDAQMTGMTGGPFAPSCLTYTLTNVGGASLNWFASMSKPWLDVTPSAGTLAPGASANVDVCTNAFANSLAVGNYMATTRFTNSGSGVNVDKTAALEIQQVITSYNMDTNPGFALAGAWAYGVPTGGGDHNGDPTSGYTGANVLGYNLAGDYTNSLPATAIKSPTFDCSTMKNVSLSFWRWLAIEEAGYDHAKVQVSNNGTTWHDVWNHNAGNVSPTSWTHVSYDISAVADGQATVWLRWVMGATDSSNTYPGWNIDDIVISGVPTMDPADPILPPTLTVTEPTRLFARPGQQVSYDLYYDGAKSITLAPEDITLLATGTAGADVFITGTGTLQRKVRLLNLTGNGWLALNVDSGTGYDAFGEMANAAHETAWFKVDSTPPDIYISPPTLAITDSGPVTYNVIYSGADGIPLSLADVVLSSTSTANGVMSVLGTGKTLRKVRFTGTTGNGRLGFSLNANTAYDNAGNLAGAAGPSDTFRVDNVPPLNPVTTPPVASFSEPSRWFALPGHTVKYTVAYRDASSISLAPADVVFHTTGTAAADVTISGTGALQRKVNVYNLTGEGSIGFNLAAGTAANAYGSAPETPVGPQFEVDTTPPRVYVSPPSQRVTLADPVVYTVLYSGADAVTLSPTDVYLQTSGTVAASTIEITGSGRYKRKVRLSGITGKGTLGISLDAGTAVDAAGNLAAATAQSMVTRVLK